MDIRKFFGGKTNTCNSKTPEKKPTKVTKESRRSKTNRQITKVNVKTSSFVSKCKIVSKESVCSKETASDLSAVVTRGSSEDSKDNETNNNNDSQKTVSEPDGRRSKQSEAKEKGRAEINGKSPKNVKGHKENKKITAKCETVLPDEEETVTIIDGSDDEVQKKPTKKSKLRKRYTSNKNASDEEVQRKPTKRSKSTKDLSDESDEEVQRRPKKKPKSTKDLFDESDEEVQRRPKKKLKSRKGGVIFDSDSGEEDPLPTSHKKTPRRRKKKEVTVVLDSGDEFEPIKEAFAKMTPKIKSPSKPKTSPPKQKPVSVLDFFGMAAVQQEERKTVATKRKSGASLEQGDKSVEEHDDSDFERTLEQLDNTSPRKKIKLDLEESADTGNVSAVSSLSSKLASRAKHFVEETPEKPLSQRTPHFANRGSTVDLTSSPVKNSVTSDRKVTPSQVTPSKATPVKSRATPVKSTPTRSMSTRSTPSKKSPPGAAGSPGKVVSVKSSESVKKCSVTSDRKVTPSKVTPSKATPVKSRATPVKSTPTTSMSTRSTPSKKSPPWAAGSPGKVVSVKSPESVKKSPQEASPAVRTPHRGASFRSYLNREGPRALGSKEIPQGGENCLEGLTFVITGVLESLERDEAQSLIQKYGGKVTKSLSKKTSYLVAGRDAGESKMAKAESLKTPQIDEDGLLQLIAKRPGKKSKYEIAAEKELKMKPEKKTNLNRSLSVKSENSQSDMKSKVSEESRLTSDCLGGQQESSQSTGTSGVEMPGDSLLWVDKYKPQSLKQIIGQLGEKSNARKLLNWLTNWHRNVASGKKPAFNRFSDDGSGYRAALLSGPPGIGKTTTAQLVCKEAGFSFVELNASDTRSKKSLQQEVAATLDNTTLTDFYGKTAKSCGTRTNKDCILMDEVDGMAGNEDRGGIQELIQLIKHTKMPIICMCNDRNHMKMRSLSNYTFDLRFQRPRVEQIKAAMMSISFKEGLKIPAPAMNEIIIASNHDIRQVIHNLSMWTANDKACSYEQLKSDAKKAKKDIKLGPFDVARKVFVGGEETSHMTINDKSDLFFHDYSFGPLFVQENYIHVTPFAARGDTCKHLELLSAAADSISDGDLVDRKVRSAQAWNLLPIQAVYASVLPGEIMRGNIGQMIQFPSWLGKNSSRTKHDRQVQELTSHMRLRVLTDKNGLNLDYLPNLRRALTEPLIHEGQEGVSRVVSLLDDYDLMREDFESIIEVTHWPNMKEPMKELIESKVKAAFTRMYNKEVHLTPYAITSGAKKGKRKGSGDADLGKDGEETVVSEESDQEDVMADGMIKQKKKPRKTSQTKAPADTKKGKGKGTGKGKGKK